MAERIRRSKRKKAVIRRKKEFTYRGKTIEELKAMSLDELMQLLPARARRTLKRGFSEENQKLIERIRKGDKDVLRTHRRDLIIVPELIGKRIAVHHGNGFKDIEITPEMIGHYLGEFALTRKPVTHAGPGVGATRSSKFMPLK